MRYMSVMEEFKLMYCDYIKHLYNAEMFFKDLTLINTPKEESDGNRKRSKDTGTYE